MVKVKSVRDFCLVRLLRRPLFKVKEGKWLSEDSCFYVLTFEYKDKRIPFFRKEWFFLSFDDAVFCIREVLNFINEISKRVRR